MKKNKEKKRILLKHLCEEDKRKVGNLIMTINKLNNEKNELSDILQKEIAEKNEVLKKSNQKSLRLRQYQKKIESQHMELEKKELKYQGKLVKLKEELSSLRNEIQRIQVNREEQKLENKKLEERLNEIERRRKNQVHDATQTEKVEVKNMNMSVQTYFSETPRKSRNYMSNFTSPTLTNIGTEYLMKNTPIKSSSTSIDKFLEMSKLSERDGSDISSEETERRQSSRRKKKTTRISKPRKSKKSGSRFDISSPSSEDDIDHNDILFDEDDVLLEETESSNEHHKALEKYKRQEEEARKKIQHLKELQRRNSRNGGRKLKEPQVVVEHFSSPIDEDGPNVEFFDLIEMLERDQENIEKSFSLEDEEEEILSDRTGNKEWESRKDLQTNNIYDMLN